MSLVACSSPFVASVEFAVATMDSAAYSSALGLVFAAALPMEKAMVASLPLQFATSGRTLVVATAGALFVVTARLLRMPFVCRARPRLLA
jgi:hypothetical protein